MEMLKKSESVRRPSKKCLGRSALSYWYSYLPHGLLLQLFRRAHWSELFPEPQLFGLFVLWETHWLTLRA